MSMVLSVYNAYFNRGGEDEVFDAEANLLEMRGHSVRRFRVEVDDLKRASVIRRAQLAAAAVWSRQYFQRFRELVRDLRPDVVHFHNTFPLISPSAYSACKAEGVAVVQTLHNYRLVCPNALFFRDGHPCEDCLGMTPPWPGVLHACYRNSRSQTAVVAAMLTAHRLRGTWTSDVDIYIALTNFARRKFVEGGLPPDKITVKPNFVHPDPGVGSRTGNFVLFVGRLATNKGVETLMRAWELLKQATPLYVVGDGPLDEVCRRASESSPNIKYEGRLARKSVLGLMREARALIFPSEWYEAFPVTIVEAFASGLPVITSRLGAMAEIIDDGRTGLHFAPGEAADLAARVEWAWMHPDEMERMGREARHEYETKYTSEQNCRQLLQIYEHAIAGAEKRRR